MTVEISMACNDPDSGNFAGYVSQISLPDSMLHLTAIAWGITTFRGCPQLREIPGHFVLSGKRWPFIHRRDWVGNWCWNSYTVDHDTATKFLTWLHRKDTFHCEGGWLELAAAWDGPTPLRLPEKWWDA